MILWNITQFSVDRNSNILFFYHSATQSKFTCSNVIKVKWIYAGKINAIMVSKENNGKTPIREMGRKWAGVLEVKE